MRLGKGREPLLRSPVRISGSSLTPISLNIISMGCEKRGWTYLRPKTVRRRQCARVASEIRSAHAALINKAPLVPENIGTAEGLAEMGIRRWHTSCSRSRDA
jgi:hypothetical protein